MPQTIQGAEVSIARGLFSLATQCLECTVGIMNFIRGRDQYIESQFCVLNSTGISRLKWWAIQDSNLRPQSYQDCALTS